MSDLASPVAETEPLLAANASARRFGDTRALVDCSFEVCPGEVHALIGENGSGKSTLVKILSGVLAPDEGTLRVGGQDRSRLGSPGRARRLGIIPVFQEILVVEYLSVLDNIWLGMDGMLRRRVAPERKRARAEAVLDALSSLRPVLDRPMSRLNLGQRQLVVIARALVRDPKLLILDEATSALDVSDRDRLFEELRRLCGTGVAVIFISHRMDELAQISDRVTVLRSGESVATLSREEADVVTLLSLMSGREPERVASGALGKAVDAAAPGAASVEHPVVLRSRGLVLRDGSAGIDFELRAGEIVGLAGLEGQGQDEFARAVAGLIHPVAGDVVSEPGGRRLGSAEDAARARVAYVPRDRKSEGIFEPLSILENFAVRTFTRDRRIGVLRPRASRARFRDYRSLLNIRLGRDADLITSLSGGNQQKVVMARQLATEPRVLVLNDPTRGVDLGTKQDIYRLLRRLADDGVAVVLLSSELEEHIALVDRVLVFRSYELFSDVPHEDMTRHLLVAAMFGKTPEEIAVESSPGEEAGGTDEGVARSTLPIEGADE